MNQSMRPAAVRVDGVTWRLGSSTVLEEISLTARAGTVTGLLGPNGSGKTSLLHILAGLRRPDRGVVRFGEYDVHRMRPRDRARLLALVEQEAATGLDPTVRQVVELGRLPHRSRWVSDDAAGARAVEEAMRTAHVSALSARRWRTLSGGERQRTHLARALAQEPGVLLLDEPTNHLDLRHQLDFLGRVRGLGLTVVTALHDLELAAAYCDDLVVLDRGRLVAHGPVADVLTPRLLAGVYGVDAAIEQHPTQARPHVRWNGVLDPISAGADRAAPRL